MTDDPARVGRYDILGVLGRGAMGVVYRAHDPEIDRPVALKLVHAFLLGGDEQAEFIARFRREAQAAARCAHPNVVAVYDYALHAGDPFLAMEFVDGVSLAALRQQKPRLLPAEAVTIVRQVLAGLGAAHAAGIVHRDVKPANIMLTRAGIAKVTDFGISRLDSSSLTATGMTVGTPSYMSPEQARGDRVDARSDLYSAAVVLYEMLAGTRPFAPSSAGALYLRLASETAPDIRVHLADCPPRLAEALARALARDSADRYPDAAAMTAALTEALAGAQVGGAVGGDATVVSPGRPAPSAEPAADTAWAAALERSLAEHLGPIARVLVQSAIRRAPDPDAVNAELAAAIDDPAARDRFARQANQLRPGASQLGKPAAGAAIDPAELERLHAALSRAIGPVARVLIKRAQAATLAELWQEMATHIEPPAERAAFLAAEPGRV